MAEKDPCEWKHDDDGTGWRWRRKKQPWARMKAEGLTGKQVVTSTVFF